MLDAGYDEAMELEAYIWRNYRRLLPKQELIAHHYYGESRSPEIEQFIQERWGEEILETLKTMEERGGDFRSTACERLLREHGDEIVINRCPVCARIVLTPLAQQCLWCGHSWHKKSKVN